MSDKVNACAAKLAELVFAKGRKNGQRWVLEPGEFKALLAEHFETPKPAKKKTAKKKD